ncbi:MAG: hypothetical protein WCK65_13860, partial [Rhodospirillaceae bacterium]
MLSSRKLCVVTAVMIIAVANVLVFHRVFLLSGFDAVPGAIGDGLYNLAVLEHWRRVVTVAESWSSPNWYYPVTGVLGYSDALVLLAPPYVAARLLGLGAVASLGLAQISASALGFAGMVVVLRGLLSLAWPAVLAGAAGFATASGLYQSLTAGHVQMMAIEALPWFAALGLLYLRSGRAGWGAVAALMLSLILCTSFYVGWFICVQMIVAGGLTVVLFPGLVGGWVVAQRWSIIRVGAAFVFSLLPFISLYGSVALHSPPRPWAEVVRTLPDITQLFEVRGAAVWGPV